MKVEDKKGKLFLADLLARATLKGGRCLSMEYINYNTPLTWQCSKGHTFEVSPFRIKKGTWCKVCSGWKMGTIEEMQKLAKTKGGECLSEEYKNSRLKLLWRCKNGHTWLAPGRTIKEGKWCGACIGNFCISS